MANRQRRVVQHVTEEGAVYVREVGSGRRDLRTVALLAEYVAEHAHLPYAATAYGVQGATVESSHTVLTEATSAAGVYVGMIRGGETNRLHVAAESMADARVQFIEAMERDPADRGLDHANAQAVEVVRGIVADSPVRLVTEEIARLDHEAERPQRQAERWEQVAAGLDARRVAYRAEDDEIATVLRKAEREAERERAEIAGPLTKQAEADGAAYFTAVRAEAAASARLATVGRFGRRKARTDHQDTREQAQTQREQIRAAWGEPPRTVEALAGWAEQQAAKRAETDPRVIDSAQHIDAAKADRDDVRQRHEQERRSLLVSAYGAEQTRRTQFGMRTINPHRNAHDARMEAATARTQADELRSLPVSDAARHIKAGRAAQEEARRLDAERTRRLHEPYERGAHRTSSRRDGPSLRR